jgi:hypothetical protein
MMRKDTKYHVNIRIDKLTNSIVNTISRGSFVFVSKSILKAQDSLM